MTASVPNNPERLSQPDEDDYDDGYVGPDDDCDCMEADVDILTGRAHCLRCGNAWWLTSEALKRELELHAELCEAYYEQEIAK
jgi:hypothetical protein